MLIKICKKKKLYTSISSYLHEAFHNACMMLHHIYIIRMKKKEYGGLL